MSESPKEKNVVDKMQIVQYAGITVMFPAALVIAVWLWLSASRKIALLWMGVLVTAYLVVGVSKILFKGWGIGLHDLGIAVFSGHAMNACLVFTVMLNLLCQQLDQRLRWPALVAGLLATWWFAINYVAHTIHPLPEAIAGALIGSVAACVMVFSLRHYNVSHVPRPALALGLAVVMAFSCMPKYTAERLLDHIAITLSGADQAFRHSS
ncbi:hypothetical protein [Pseudomonas fragi]|uniref:hypothetical protein n=1 Tax=Pseudomonas fragi TaxID=296 RepID=UPI002682F02C